MNCLTKTERRLLETFSSKGRVTLRGLRLLIRLVAHHEAGHVAARLFTGQELSHVVRVSIIPGGGSLGRETTERCVEEATIGCCPTEAMRLSTGRQLLISLMAGRGAMARLYGQDIREYILRGDPEEWGMEGSDLFRAGRIAGIIAGTSGSPPHILEQAAEWTAEMLEVPAVWRAVRRLARGLLKHGSMDGDAIMDVCDDVILLGLSLPKWKRRLHAGAGKS